MSTNTNGTRPDYDQRQQLLADFKRTTVYAIAAALNAREPGSCWQVEQEAEPGAGSLEFARLVNVETAEHGVQPERISLSLDGWDRRIIARGAYGLAADGSLWSPRDRVRGAENPNPSMSADKTPEQLAGDIGRRLLPTYRQILQAYREQFVRETQARLDVAQTAAALTQASGGRLSLSKSGSRSERAYSGFLTPLEGITHGHVVVHSPDCVRIEASLSAERARQLVAWLAAQPLEGGE